MADQPTYRVTLKAQPWVIPAQVRLRRLLKTALRAFGFRVIVIEELDPVTTQVTVISEERS